MSDKCKKRKVGVGNMNDVLFEKVFNVVKKRSMDIGALVMLLPVFRNIPTLCGSDYNKFSHILDKYLTKRCGLEHYTAEDTGLEQTSYDSERLAVKKLTYKEFKKLASKVRAEYCSIKEMGDVRKMRRL